MVRFIVCFCAICCLPALVHAEEKKPPKDSISEDSPQAVDYWGDFEKANTHRHETSVPRDGLRAVDSNVFDPTQRYPSNAGSGVRGGVGKQPVPRVSAAELQGPLPARPGQTQIGPSSYQNGEFVPQPTTQRVPTGPAEPTVMPSQKIERTPASNQSATARRAATGQTATPPSVHTAQPTRGPRRTSKIDSDGLWEKTAAGKSPRVRIDESPIPNSRNGTTLGDSTPSSQAIATGGPATTMPRSNITAPTPKQAPTMGARMREGASKVMQKTKDGVQYLRNNSAKIRKTAANTMGAVDGAADIAGGIHKEREAAASEDRDFSYGNAAFNSGMNLSGGASFYRGQQIGTEEAIRAEKSGENKFTAYGRGAARAVGDMFWSGGKNKSEKIIEEELVNEIRQAEKEGREVNTTMAKGRAAVRVVGEVTGVNTIAEAVTYDAEADRNAVRAGKQLHEKSKTKLESQLKDAWKLQDEYERLSKSDDPAERARARAVQEQYEEKVRFAKEEHGRVSGRGLLNDNDPELMMLRGALNQLPEGLATDDPSQWNQEPSTETPTEVVEQPTSESTEENNAVEVAAQDSANVTPPVEETNIASTDETSGETSEVAQGTESSSEQGGEQAVAQSGVDQIEVRTGRGSRVGGRERLSPDELSEMARSAGVTTEVSAAQDAPDVPVQRSTPPVEVATTQVSPPPVQANADELDIDAALAELDTAMGDLGSGQDVSTVSQGVSRSAANVQSRMRNVERTSQSVRISNDAAYGRAAQRTSASTSRIASSVEQSSQSAHQTVVRQRQEEVRVARERQAAREAQAARVEAARRDRAAAARRQQQQRATSSRSSGFNRGSKTGGLGALSGAGVRNTGSSSSRPPKRPPSRAPQNSGSLVGGAPGDYDLGTVGYGGNCILGICSE